MHPATVFATLNNGSSPLVNSADNRAGDLLVFGSDLRSPERWAADFPSRYVMSASDVSGWAAHRGDL
jgi:hypothetical protein